MSMHYDGNLRQEPLLWDCGPQRHPRPPPPPEPCEPHASLLTGLAKLLETGELTDLKILCGNKQFAVHKNVICCQSKPLMAMCTNGMKESQESVIDLTVDTEPCVSRLVDFLYRCDYDELEDNSEDACRDNGEIDNGNVALTNDEKSSTKSWPPHVTIPQLSLHVDMYVLSDKYDIASLGELAKKKFRRLPKQSGLDTPSLPVLEMIPRIYAVTGQHNMGLRDVVVEYARVQRTKTEWKTPFTDKIAELFETVPEFAVDVLHSWLKLPKSFVGHVVILDATDTGLKVDVQVTPPEWTSEF